MKKTCKSIKGNILHHLRKYTLAKSAMQSVLKTYFLAAPFKQADFVQKLDYFSFPKQFKVHSPNSPPTAGCCGQPCMHVCRSLTHSLHSDVKYPPLSTRHPLPSPELHYPRQVKTWSNNAGVNSLHAFSKELNHGHFV